MAVSIGNEFDEENTVSNPIPHARTLRLRISAFALLPAGLLVASFLRPEHTLQHEDTPAPDPFAAALHERQFDYRDHYDGRIVANVQARLVIMPAGTELRVTVSAVGPRVQPDPGFEGIGGVNLTTAKEMSGILARGDLVVRTRPVDGGAATTGWYHPTRRGRLNMRRVRPDGMIDHQARTPVAYVWEWIAVSGPLKSGEYETALLVKGRNRLRIRFTVDPIESSILSIDDPSLPYFERRK